MDILRGQRRPPGPDLDALFAISTAEPTLVVNLGLTPMTRAGVCVKPVQMAQFASVVDDSTRLLDATGVPCRRIDDELGFTWLVVDATSVQDLVVAVHAVNRGVEEAGFGSQLLCSVFGFRDGDQPLLLVYAYKRGRFYPFAPRGEGVRDVAAELRINASLAGELPMEPDLERWYPVWGAPVTPTG